jgi:lipopolysaccharide export system protein LptA
MLFKQNRKLIYKSLTVLVRLLLCISVSILSINLNAQHKVKKEISIEADTLLFDEAIVKDAQRLIGNVKFSHKNIVLFCDSAWSYQSSNSVDAFGNVHAINNDTLHIYANIIHYIGDESLAKARGNVILKDPKLTLTTDSLDFDSKNNIGYYNTGGKIVDSTNTLTSIIGRYYSQNNELFFKDSVKLVNKDYIMTSDTMKYNTKTEIVHIVGPTHIIGDSSYLYSENGWFDTQKNVSELLKNSTIRKGNTQLQGDYIYFDDNSGEGNAKGNVIINDFKNSIIIAGNKATYNDFSQNAFITDSALFVQYQNKDSLFLHADTLYTQPDTSAINQKMVITYKNVRFFKPDMQGACDSLVYYSKDSTIQLFDDPILWSENDQLTADFIEVINNSKPPSEVHMQNNSFIIQKIDTSKFNQIKGKNMAGLLNGSKLYQINVSGNGQSIYYPADEKSIIGMNKAESSNIALYLSSNKIRRISFLKSPTGTLNPILEKIPADSQLPGFKWRGSEKPLNKFDIFRNKNGLPLPSNLPKSNIENPLPDFINKRVEVIDESKKAE